MSKTRRIYLGIASAAFLFQACSSKPVAKDGPIYVPPSEAPAAPSLEARKGPVWVVKSDGSKSCGVKKGITPKQASQELEASGVKVQRARMGHDGQMRMMVCGADTGNRVELLIDGQFLPSASEKGFRVKGED
jgi:hypothetical protein